MGRKDKKEEQRVKDISSLVWVPAWLVMLLAITWNTRRGDYWEWGVVRYVFYID